MEEKQRILLVEDDRRLAGLVQDYLCRQGFDVQVESRGDTAAERIISENPHLVILDLMLPGEDGLSVCRSVRADYPGPILILTAREDDMDQVAGLEIGADDYVKKPIEPRVLLARIRALLRRVHIDAAGQTNAAQPSAADTMIFGSLSIIPTSRSVHLDGRQIELKTSEFDLLLFLAGRSGQIVDRDTVYKQLRGIEYDGLDRSVDLTVSRLRKKLGDDATRPQRIKTVWGKGYLFVADAWT